MSSPLNHSALISGITLVASACNPQLLQVSSEPTEQTTNLRDVRVATAEECGDLLSGLVGSLEGLKVSSIDGSFASEVNPNKSGWMVEELYTNAPEATFVGCVELVDADGFSLGFANSTRTDNDGEGDLTVSATFQLPSADSEAVAVRTSLIAYSNGEYGLVYEGASEDL